MHGLGEVDGIQHLHTVASPDEHPAALNNEAALGVGHDEADLFRHLHQVRLDEKSRLAGAGPADDDDVLVPGVFGKGRPPVHGQPFRSCEDDVVLVYGIDERGDVLRCAPTGGTVLPPMSELLGVAGTIGHNQPHGGSSGNADQQIAGVEANEGLPERHLRVGQQYHQPGKQIVSWTIAVQPSHLIAHPGDEDIRKQADHDLLCVDRGRQARQPAGFALALLSFLGTQRDSVLSFFFSRSRVRWGRVRFMATDSFFLTEGFFSLVAYSEYSLNAASIVLTSRARKNTK